MGCFGLFAVSGTNFSIDSIVNVIPTTAKVFHVTDAILTIGVVSIVPSACMMGTVLGSVEWAGVRDILGVIRLPEKVICLGCCFRGVLGGWSSSSVLSCSLCRVFCCRLGSVLRRRSSCCVFTRWSSRSSCSGCCRCSGGSCFCCLFGCVARCWYWSWRLCWLVVWS